MKTLKDFVKGLFHPSTLEVITETFSITKKALVVVALIGYMLNVYHIYNAGVITYAQIDGKMTLKLLGVIFPPLGAVVGYM